MRVKTDSKPKLPNTYQDPYSFFNMFSFLTSFPIPLFVHSISVGTGFFLLGALLQTSTWLAFLHRSYLLCVASHGLSIWNYNPLPIPSTPSTPTILILFTMLYFSFFLFFFPPIAIFSANGLYKLLICYIIYFLFSFLDCKLPGARNLCLIHWYNPNIYRYLEHCLPAMLGAQ